MAATPEGPALLVTLPGGVRLRVPVRLVRRVDEPDSCRRIPLAPDGVRGIAEVRGRIVTLLDPFRLAAAPGGPAKEVTSLLLLEEPFAHLAIALPSGTAVRPPAPGQDPDAPFVTDRDLEALVGTRGPLTGAVP